MPTRSLALFMLLLAFFAHAEQTNDVRLRFDSTTICVPRPYVPGANPLEQYLEANAQGLDESGQSQIIELPAKLIMAGVSGYSFNHINKHNVALEHTINGIANGMSEVTRSPELNMACDDRFDLGYCYQEVVYKDVFFQYSLKTVEAKNKENVSKYLYMLFQRWEKKCVQNG